MIVTVFRSRARTDLSADVIAKLTRIGTRMAELAPTMPGFISYSDYASSDGESVTVVEFQTMEDTLRWRHHPEHRQAQEYGRAEAFSEYRVQVCEQLRESRFP
jgi:heme-degrading monooxygenase HmoA